MSKFPPEFLGNTNFTISPNFKSCLAIWKRGRVYVCSYEATHNRGGAPGGKGNELIQTGGMTFSPLQKHSKLDKLMIRRSGNTNLSMITPHRNPFDVAI